MCICYFRANGASPPQKMKHFLASRLRRWLCNVEDRVTQRRLETDLVRIPFPLLPISSTVPGPQFSFRSNKLLQ